MLNPLFPAARCLFEHNTNATHYRHYDKCQRVAVNQYVYMDCNNLNIATLWPHRWGSSWNYLCTIMLVPWNTLVTVVLLILQNNVLWAVILMTLRAKDLFILTLSMGISSESRDINIVICPFLRMSACSPKFVTMLTVDVERAPTAHAVGFFSWCLCVVDKDLILAATLVTLVWWQEDERKEVYPSKTSSLFFCLFCCSLRTAYHIWPHQGPAWTFFYYYEWNHFPSPHEWSSPWTHNDTRRRTESVFRL